MFASRFALCLFLVGLTALGAVDANAAGNVLLPSTNSDSNSAPPNLGLVPSQTAAPAPAPSAPATPSPSLPVTAPAKPAASALPYTAAPSSSAALPAIPQMPPTQVIQLPVHTISPNLNANLPNVLTIQVADQMTWGSTDLMMVNRRLGFPEDKIPALCHLLLTGQLQSDNKTSLIDSSGSPQFTVRYAGPITGASFYLHAMCDRVPLAANLGPILQRGDKYEVMLGGATCPAPTSQPVKLLVSYLGNSKMQCQYQYPQ